VKKNIYHDKYNRIRFIFRHSNANRLNYIITSVLIGMSMLEFRTLGTLEPVGLGYSSLTNDMHLRHCLGEKLLNKNSL
jgi:hypothetical protein